MFDCIKQMINYLDPFYTISKEQNLITLTPKDKNYPINSSLIFMHGLGDSGEGYVNTFQDSSRPVPNTTRVLLPTAPLSPVSFAGGQLMNSWFDFKGFTSENDVSQQDIMKNTKMIIELVHQEAKKFNGDYKKVFVGGFSQGASIALSVGLNIKEKIGGVVALSGILFPCSTSQVDVNSKKDLPIYIGHGIQDTMLSYDLAMESYKFFTENKFSEVKMKEFDIGHTVNKKELAEVSDFIYMNSIKYYV